MTSPGVDSNRPNPTAPPTPATPEKVAPPPSPSEQSGEPSISLHLDMPGISSSVRSAPVKATASRDSKSGRPSAGGQEKSDLDNEVAQALGGLSIEQLMEQSAAAKLPMGRGESGPRMDPSRPVRGGRPSARRHVHEDHINPDNIKRGKVIAIREGNVFVEIGGKSQGMCPLDQFDEAPVTDEAGEKKGVEIGQEYEFIFKGYDAREGLVLLARRGAVQHGAWETLKTGDTVEATVSGVNKGGLELKVGTTRAFMPAGQVDVKFHPDLSVFLNQRLTVRVLKVDREEHQILLSRRAIIEEEEEKKAQEIWGELSVGQVREGTVRSVQPYGAFIDLGGVDGLLHVSAMSHQRVADPKKILKEGDKLQVMVVNIDEEKKRVSLSLKQLTKDPWETVPLDYPVGATVEGTVKKVVDFGAFVELAAGIEGLVHVSQIAMRRVARPGDVVKEGDKIKAKVTHIDLDKRRISLSMAEAEREGKIASGEIKVEEPKLGTAGPTAPAVAAKGPVKPKKQLKGGIF